MANTPHLNITLLEQSQAQKEVTVNDAFNRIDAVLNSGAIDKDLATPPGSPAQGDVYIIAASATGLWSGKSGQVTYFDQIWNFITPRAGLMVWVIDEAKHYVYNGSAWIAVVYVPGSAMVASTYDPANIAQQLVGTTATQTLTNKTLTSPTVNGATMTGTVTVPTQTASDNSTKVASTAYVDTALAGVSVTSPLVVEGRLTLTTGVPVTTSDVTGATNIYFTPYGGNRITLYNGSAWQILTFSEITHALGTVTSGRPYDVFAYINTGAVAIEKLAWTSDTARATALTTQNGALVKSGDATRRYLGTFYTTSTTATEDSAAKRYVWNYYNRKLRHMAATAESTGTWNYSTATYRQANANAANQLNYMIGYAEDVVSASLPPVTIYNSTTTYRSVGLGIGLDSTSTNSASYSTEGRCNTTVQALVAASYDEVATLGRHYLAWLEKGGGTDTQSFYTSNSGGYGSVRITGRVFA